MKLQLLKIRILSIFLAFSIIFVGCRKQTVNTNYLGSYIPATENEQSVGNAYLQIGVVCSAIDDDCLCTYNHQLHSINELVFDSLFKKTSIDEFSENLIKTYSQSKTENDFVLWSFTIRSDVFFNKSGEKLTAKDCVDTINFIRSNEGYYSESLKSIVSCSQDAPYSFSILTESNCDSIVKSLVFPILKSEDLSGTRSVMDADGTGAYIVSKDESDNNRILLNRNNDWWKSPPVFEQLYINLYNKNSDLYAAYQNRSVDFAVAETDFDSAALIPADETLIQNPDDQMRILVINPFVEHLADAGFREAVFHAINREQLTRLVLPMQAIESNTLQGFNLPVKNYGLSFDYDPQRAENYINEYHKELASDTEYCFRMIVESSIDDRTDNSIASFICSDLKNVGIKTEISVLDSASFRSALSNNNYDMAIYHLSLRDFASVDIYNEIEKKRLMHK